MHGIWDEVISSGQYFTHRAYLGGDMLDAVDDLPILRAKNDVAVFSHDLNNEHFAADIAQLV